jgi:hypothetical protein
MHCANFPRHLGRQITRCLIAHRQADTTQLADWAYGAGPHPTWHRWNIIRHCRKWGIQPIGKRKTGKDGRPRLVWALRWRRCPSKRRSWRLPPTSATRALRRCLTAQSPDHERRRSRSNTAPTRPPRALPGADHCAMTELHLVSDRTKRQKEKPPDRSDRGFKSRGE